MSAEQKISFSKLTTFRTCHKQYDYRYNQKLRRKQRSEPLLTGGSVHDALEAFYKGKSFDAVLKKGKAQFNKLFKEERERLGDIPGITRSMVERYIDNWEDADLTTLETEKEFAVDIGDGIILGGKIDLIATDSADRIWVEEHKTCKTMPDEATRMADIQSIIYGSKEIMTACGYPGGAHGVIWDYLRKKIPAVPELLKSGDRLSKKKDIDTTPEIYRKAIEDNNLDPNDYQDILEKLEFKEEAFFKRIKLPLSKRMTKIVFADALSTGKQIREFGKVWTDRNAGKMRCGYCDYFKICQAEMRGAPDDYIREHEYEISTGRPKNGKEKVKVKSKSKVKSKTKAKVKRSRAKDKTSARTKARNKPVVLRKKRDR